jgi:hypothetical protein
MVSPHVTTSFRPRSSLALTGGSWIVTAGLLVSGGLTDGVGRAVLAAPIALAAGLLAWLLFWYPRVDVRDDGVLVVNPWRTITVPWEALVHVTTHYALTLVTPRGRIVVWAAPGPGRHSVMIAGSDDLKGLPRSTYDARGAVGLGDLPTSSSGGAGALVRAHWEHLVETGQLDAGRADVTPVPVHWHTTAIAVLLGALLLGVALQLAF